ncbi:MAG: histidine--tRNA ligase [Actinobacteria bacterium]|nr:MAG: histidine--tRNA ligase [Actinomycetota bacterium]
MSAPQPPRGTRDLLPPSSERFAALERDAAAIVERAGYRRVITPEFEATEIFTRGLGDATDVVTKEMYTFEDRSGHKLTLRPEGTAPVMRAIVTHRLYEGPLPVKLYYSAPMFRYERPQKGRYRQHFQLGIEAVGAEDPALDAEVIETGLQVLRAAGTGELTLLLNSMGHPAPECRGRYLPALMEFLERHRDELDDDCRRRMQTNPLRVFDCKVPKDQAILAEAPTIEQFLCDACREHLDAVKGYLKDAGISFVPAPRLVRGFDYYTRTTFEYQSQALDAAQNAVGGGGRYDGLVEQLGGPRLPGIGFGLGVERILLAQEAAGEAPPPKALDVYVVPVSAEEHDLAVRVVRAVREAGLAADMPYADRGLKANLKAADRLGARYAALIGAAERDAGTATLREMTSGKQEAVPLDDVAARVRGQSR